MQKKLPLSSRPPLKSIANTEDLKLKEFIEAAESPKKSGSLSVEKNRIKERDDISLTFPWEEKNIRSDVHKVFNLRLPETYYMKLKYLSEKEKESHHKILMNIICPEIDKKIKEIISKKI